VPSLAVRVTDWAELTAVAVAVKLAVLDPAGTDTDGGTDTALLLLDRLRLKPPVGAADVRDTVQLSVPAPFKVEFLHERALRAVVAETPLVPLP
jgi:hypothetical protein